MYYQKWILWDTTSTVDKSDNNFHLFCKRFAFQSTSGPVQVGGHGHCKSPIPAMKNFDEKEVYSAEGNFSREIIALISVQFEGLWYLDSSSLYYWTTPRCHAYNFTWHPKHFAHDHKSYLGYFQYYVRMYDLTCRTVRRVQSRSQKGAIGAAIPTFRSSPKFKYGSYLRKIDLWGMGRILAPPPICGRIAPILAVGRG